MNENRLRQLTSQLEQEWVHQTLDEDRMKGANERTVERQEKTDGKVQKQRDKQ